MSDRATFDAYAVWADQNLPGKRYWPTYVEITSASPTKINFLALDGNKVWKPCSAIWGDLDAMWAAFPSTLPSGAQGPTTTAGPVPGAPPASGAFGILYLSDDCIQQYGIAPPKWPRSF